MANQPLPEFERPPLAEVVLGVQFEPLESLRSPQIGLLWQRYREEFPQAEEHPALEPVIERFGRPPGRLAPRIVVDVQSFLTPRILFLAASGEQLLQVQQDRFICNWRKLEDGQIYPRYDGKLRSAFTDSVRRFEEFLHEEDLGAIHPNQCEVTYVNVVPGKDAPKLADLLTVLSCDDQRGFLPDPETEQVVLRFVMGSDQEQPIGRLHVVTEPRVKLPSGEPVHRLTLTARGAPLGEGIEGVLGFFDAGREWIVRAFAELTTVRMHDHWGRKA